MFNKSIINNFFKLGIKTWLKSISTSIEIKSLKLIFNNKVFGKVDEIYLEANNLIYKNIYINKIIIKIYECNLKFNYRNNILYSDDLFINSILTIDNRNLENIFFSSKYKRLRINIQNNLTEGENISNLIIKNNLIIFNYEINKLIKAIPISLNLGGNLFFLENINNKKRFFIPLDKNIKINSCNIKDKLIKVNLSSKVLFDN